MKLSRAFERYIKGKEVSRYEVYGTETHLSYAIVLMKKGVSKRWPICSMK